MSRRATAILAMLATITPAVAQRGKEPLILKPTTPWNVDYADDRCRLMRQFGEGDEQTFAIFDRYAPDDDFQLILVGRPFKSTLDKGKVVIQFGPNEGEQSPEFFRGNLGALPAMVVTHRVRLAPPTPADEVILANQKPDDWVTLTPIGAEREKAIKTLSVSKAIRRPLILLTGPMQKPLEALGKCMDNLMTVKWGIDVARHKSLSKHVSPTITAQKWIVSSDYPLDMLEAGQPALVQFRLSVGPDGVPTACYIQSTTRPKEFDDAVCKSVMRRARFTPALDAAGVPLASFYQNIVRFQIPDF
jgi:Gram-negative bacterial TonB protein C-terminal